MTHTSRAFGMSSGGFDRRVRPDRRGPDRRRLSIAVPVDRRASNDRRINQGRRITEWFAPPGTGEQPAIQVLENTRADAVALQTNPSEVRRPKRSRRAPTPARQGPGFDSITFSHNGRQYVVDAVEMPSGPRSEPIWHWRIAVDGVVEHTLRAMPHEDPESLERRAITTLEETGAGAVRGLDFEYEGRLYHLEDRSDALSRDSLGDTAMWCITCDGVMEGSFPAPSDETESVLRARAIQIARRSGEYRARLNTKRERTSRGLHGAASRPPRTRRSQPLKPELDKPTPQRQQRPTQPRLKPVVKEPARPVAEVHTKKTPGKALPITPLDKLIVTSPTPTLNRDMPPILPLASQTRPVEETQRPVVATTPSLKAEPTVEPKQSASNTQERPAVPQPRTSQPVRSSEPTETVRTSGPQPETAEPVRTSGPLPRTSQPVRTSDAQRRQSSPRISQPSIPSRPPPRPKRRGGAWKTIMGIYAVVAAIVLMPVRPFRKPVGRNQGSKQIRTAQEWLDSTPMRMLLPYLVGATLLLGIFPFMVGVWVASGIGLVGLLTLRKRNRAEPFQIQGHRFERHPVYAPRVEVHSTGHRPVVSRRRTTPQRILQSVNRQ